MNDLVIVESPTKAQTLSKFLGRKYQIEASMGHIRDLPKSEMGVDPEHNFEPKYIIPKDKTKRVNELKKIALSAKTLWLATDPDREGEAISWHIKELLADGSSNTQQSTPDMKRVVFHEITQEAVQEAFENPRRIDLKLVDAQQARRVLDRLVGYKLSPLLWKKIKSGLSAGRVQSVALRLVVEREKEVKAFKPQEYWSIEAELEKNQGSAPIKSGSRFRAALISLNGKKLTVKNETESKKHVEVLKDSAYQVADVVKKEVRRYPHPPFTTSTLQQTASHALGFSPKKTMKVAQDLYEHGLITYMRTDSVNLSTAALSSTRAYISEKFGKNYLPSKERVFKTKSKLAQEAHEAIRPTNIRKAPEELKGFAEMSTDHSRLYSLIFKRMLACQMSEAVMDQTTVDVKAGSYTLRATGSVIKFDGWLKVYEKSTDYRDQNTDEEGAGSQILPELSKGEGLKLLQILPAQHFTEPPPRYNEASLIKKLEELGIGRPSTYAPTLSVIQERYYVEKVDRKLLPTELGTTVVDFLVLNFSEVVDYDFTAEMEDKLDEVAKGERDWRVMMKEFYLPFEKKVEKVDETAERMKVEAETTDKICPLCGKTLVIRFGRFGKFLACSGFPECKHTENMELPITAVCPKCGGEIVVRHTKKGRTFYGCKNYPKCKYASWNKPQESKQTSDNPVSLVDNTAKT